MKIAIASDGDSKNFLVSDNGATVAFYLVFENTKFLKTIQNPYVFNAGRAGIDIANIIAGQGIEIVIAGEFNEEMIKIFESQGIDYRKIKELTVKDALESIFF